MQRQSFRPHTACPSETEQITASGANPHDRPPPAEHPASLLLWLERQHIASGRLDKHHPDRDPFWRIIDEKNRQREELEQELLTEDDNTLARSLGEIAASHELDLGNLSLAEQLPAMLRAAVPIRFHLAPQIEDLGYNRLAEAIARSTY